MGGALTIAILFALSFGVVRIAAVAMRLTGLPEYVARFQSISALTGTGFSTTESELIVNYPIRRRILVALMIIGNLGLVSIAGTFIVSFVDAEPVPRGHGPAGGDDRYRNRYYLAGHNQQDAGSRNVRSGRHRVAKDHISWEAEVPVHAAGRG